jgi:signal transduction histidine kinase
VTGRPEIVAAPGSRAPVRFFSRTDNPLVRAVGRLPLGVHAKLLIAFAGIAALLVVVGLLGLRVLGQSNARVERLGPLQVRGAAYKGIQAQAEQVRQLLGIRLADPNVAPAWGAWLGPTTIELPKGRSAVILDQAIATALSRLGPATSESRLGFVPPPEDDVVLERMRAHYQSFTAAMAKIIAFDQAGGSAEGQIFQTQAINAANTLGTLADELATRTQAQANALVAENRSAYADSRRLFIAVGAASVVLALLLGFVLSWSLIGPIQRLEARVAAIAAGDFSEHLSVENKDELGALAANFNRMNDELDRLYRELETVSKHKSDFLANMSHELRTPLNAIIGFSDVLREQMFGELNERQREYVDDVRDAGRHLLSLINDILDLAKVEAGRMELEMADVSLAQALQSGLTMHGENATKGGVALALSVEPNDILIRADERKLRQVVFNLLSNAVKFTPPGGRVDISASMTNGTVEVAVADTGAGIAPEDQELIFEEFQQARGNAGYVREGTGLGLPLSRKFIELHGGRLWVESVPGAGSTFRFTLPVDQTSRAL